MLCNVIYKRIKVFTPGPLSSSLRALNCNFPLSHLPLPESNALRTTFFIVSKAENYTYSTQMLLQAQLVSSSNSFFQKASTSRENLMCKKKMNLPKLYAFNDRPKVLRTRSDPKSCAALAHFESVHHFTMYFIHFLNNRSFTTSLLC